MVIKWYEGKKKKVVEKHSKRTGILSLGNERQIKLITTRS